MKKTKEQLAGVFLVFILTALALMGMYSGTPIDRYHYTMADKTIPGVSQTK